MEAEHSLVLKCVVKQLILKHAWGSEKIAEDPSGDNNALSPRRGLCCPKQSRMELLLAFIQSNNLYVWWVNENVFPGAKFFSSLCSDCSLELTLLMKTFP